MTIATLTATETTTAKRARHHGQGPYWHCRHGYGDKGKARKATKARPIHDNKNNGMARMCMMVIMQQPQARSVHSHDDVSKGTYLLTRTRARPVRQQGQGPYVYIAGDGVQMTKMIIM